MDICQLNSDGTELLLSDFVNYESKRGKIALIEAIRCKHLEMVNLLLSFHADTRTSSRLHKKSALDWARMSGNIGLVDRINEHHQINDHVNALFTAISKHDFDAVCRLTKASSSDILLSLIYTLTWM
jgi:ankyrin repeat protein